MSWSFNAIGRPENVVAALEAHAEKISKNPDDFSRQEFEEAKPHLVGLVNQNFAKDGTGYMKPAISLTASGSASTHRASNASPEKLQSQVTVELKTLYGYVG